MRTERRMSAEVIALLAAKTVRAAFFFQADFPTGMRRLWTGKGNYTDALSQVWQGIGAIVSINAFSETIDSGSQGLTVRLDGLSPSIVNALRRAPYQGRGVEAQLAFWGKDSNGDDVLHFLDRPVWKGTLDTDDSQRSKTEVALVLYCEHRLGDILRKREWRYTHRDQQELYPPHEGQAPDTALNKMEGIQDLIVPWGKTAK